MQSKKVVEEAEGDEEEKGRSDGDTRGFGGGSDWWEFADENVHVGLGSRIEGSGDRQELKDGTESESLSSDSSLSVGEEDYQRSRRRRRRKNDQSFYLSSSSDSTSSSMQISERINSRKGVEKKPQVKRRKGYAFSTKEPKFVSAGVETRVDSETILESEQKSNDEQGPRSFGSAPALEKQKTQQLAAWQSHTTGIGLKLLSKMGFRQRLGKNEQGIIEPLEVIRRPEKLGIAAGNFAEKPSLYGKRHDKRDTEKFLAHEQKDLRRWNALHAQFEKLSRQENQNGEINEKVLNRKVQFVTPELAYAVPELLESVHMMTKQVQHETERLKAQKKLENKKLDALRTELIEEESRLLSTQKLIDQVESMRSALDATHDAETLSDFVRAAALLQNRWLKLDVYKRTFEELVCEMALRVFRKEIREYLKCFHAFDSFGDSMNDRKRFVSSMTDFISLAGGIESAFYNKLLVRTLLRELRIVFKSSNPTLLASREAVSIRDPNGWIHSLDALRPFLCDAFVNQVAEEIVLPCICHELNSWNAREDTIPPHSWIFPWLPFLGRKNVSSVFNQFAKAIGPLLKSWDPRDPSALSILSPWHPVARKMDFQGFISTKIIPNLRAFLNTLQSSSLVFLEPEACVPLKCVFQWKHVIAEDIIGQCLLDNFFAKWLDALLEKLRLVKESISSSISGEYDFTQVSKWYSEWKSVFPENIASNRYVHAGLTCGLDAMNLFLDGNSMKNVTSASLITSRKVNLGSIRQESISSSPHRSVPSSTTQISIKKAIEQLALKNGISLVPIQDRKIDDFQLFKLGNSILYIDTRRSLVMLKDKNSNAFSPTSIHALLNPQ